MIFFFFLFLIALHAETLYLLNPKAVTEIIDQDKALNRSDEEMERIWGPIRLSEQKGLKPTLFTSARLYAFGGGQDLPYFLEYGTNVTKESLDDLPSMLLISGAGKVYAEVSLARDETGNHLKNVIQYVNPILGHNIEMKVPIKLQEPGLETERGQLEAAHYKWGNLNGLRGLRVLVTTDNPLIMATGGFEVSNAYNWNLDLWSRVFLNQLGASSSTGELFAISRFTSQNVLKDPSGFQGVLSALGGISRNYFNQHIIQRPYGQELCQKIAHYLNHHAMIILPKASFYKGSLVSPRQGKYTSKMMSALAIKGHKPTLDAIEEMRRLVSTIEKALLMEDTAALVKATARYTDLRVKAQATWLQLAREAKDKADHPYHSFFLNAQQDPFLNQLLIENVSDFQTLAPYLGSHFALLELAYKHNISCIPNGAGGFHCSWAIFGAPENLHNFLVETNLSEEISLDVYQKTVKESENKVVSLQGKIRAQVDPEPGLGANRDFIEIYGPFEQTLPVCDLNYL